MPKKTASDKTAGSQLRARSSASHTITYKDPVGGNTTIEQTVTDGNCAVRPTDPIRPGYAFDGWFIWNTSIAYDFSQPVSDTITLEAHWTKGSNTWNLNPNHGSTAGNTPVTLTSPTMLGTRFSQISAGDNHSLAIGSDGNLYSWGNNKEGQLGRETGTNTYDAKPGIAAKPDGVSDTFTWTQAIAGYDVSMALGSDGNLYSWGDNEEGQLGRITPKGNDGLMESDQKPKPVSKPANVVSGFTWTKTSTSGNSSMSFGSDGNLYSWGNNASGQLGRSTVSYTYDATPGLVTKPKDASATFFWNQASAGGFHSLALGSDGNLYSWGSNDNGQLGRDENSGTNKPNSLPTKVRGLDGISIANASAGYLHSLAVDTNGNLYAWGNNDFGQQGSGTGSNATPSQIKQITGVVFSKASAGRRGSLALDESGSVYTWGVYGSNGRVTGIPAGVSITQAVAGAQHYLALGSDGNLYSWGKNDQGQLGNGTKVSTDRPSQITFPEAPVATSITFDGKPGGTSLVSNSDGTWSTTTPKHAKGRVEVIITWVMNGQRQTRLSYWYDGPKRTVTFGNSNNSGITAVDMPMPQSVAEDEQAKRPYPDPKSDGYRFDGWFLNDADGSSDVAYDFSQPVTGDLSLVAHWSPIDTHWSINPSQGNVLGGQQATITPPGHSRGIRFNQVSAGGEQASVIGFSVGVASDGNAYAWGNNQYGQLGQDPAKTTMQNTPTKVPLPDGVAAGFTYTQVAAGGAHTLAIGSDGILYSWGRNDHGQLGDGTTTDQYKPQPVNNPDTGQSFKTVRISAGAFDSAAIDDQGYVYTWGCEHNSYSDYGTDKKAPTLAKDPNGSSQGLHAVQVSVKWSFILALDEDGNVYAWGYNTNGQLGNGTATGDGNASYANDPKPVQDPKDASKTFKATQISVGTRHALAIGKEDGSLYTWGKVNDTNYTRPTNDPANTGNDFKATQISAGTWHSLAIDQDGNAWGWGWNYYGQTGSGSTSDQQATPIKVTGPNKAGQGFKAVCISASHNHSLAIGQDGNAYAWGKNDYNQLGNTSIPTTGNSPKPIQTMFDPTPLNITGIRFDQTVIGTLRQNTDGSVTLATPAHNPGRADVIVDWTLGGIVQTQAHLPYTYEGMLPHAGSSGAIILLVTGLLAAGGAAAAGRHRREARSLQA